MIHLASKLNQTNLDETVVNNIFIPKLFLNCSNLNISWNQEQCFISESLFSKIKPFLVFVYLTRTKGISLQDRKISQGYYICLLHFFGIFFTIFIWQLFCYINFVMVIWEMFCYNLIWKNIYYIILGCFYYRYYFLHTFYYINFGIVFSMLIWNIFCYVNFGIYFVVLIFC